MNALAAYIPPIYLNVVREPVYFKQHVYFELGDNNRGPLWLNKTVCSFER